jgi:L-arabinose isomerase
VKIGEKIPKAGLVLFEAKWFLDLGIGEKGSKMGDLGTLLENEIKKIESSLKKEINLINPGIIFDIESAGKALDLFKREKVDLIIVCNLTWSEDRAWIEILKNIEDIPIIYWEYMTGFYTTKRYTPLQLYHNSGIVGALQGSGSLKRFNKKFKLVMGEAREGKVVDEITSFAKASQVKNILKKSIIGLLPFRNDQMKVTCIDEYLILKKIGMILKILTLAELKEEGLKLSDGKVRTFMERNKKTFKVDKEMREKDLMYILYLFTKGPIGFTEVLNFNPEEGTINVGHPGPVNPLLAASNDEVTIVPDIEYINSNFEYPYSATLELIGKPGRVTMVNILDIGEDIQMIISSGKSLGDHKRLTAFPHFCIKTDTPVLEFISGVIRYFNY